MRAVGASPLNPASGGKRGAGSGERGAGARSDKSLRKSRLFGSVRRRTSQPRTCGCAGQSSQAHSPLIWKHAWSMACPMTFNSQPSHPLTSKVDRMAWGRGITGEGARC